MATNFPTSLDSLTNPTSSSQLTSPSHADQHADANDAIEALQAKVGVNSSAVTTSLDYKVENLLAVSQSNRNVVINGAMQIAQRGTSVAAISTQYNTADRWGMQKTNSGTWTQSVENDAPTGSGFRKSLRMLCTTNAASPAAGDVLLIEQIFEGQNVQQFSKGTASAKQLTVSFWVKSNVTGTYVARMVDADNSRQVCATYSISASATWEKKTITFPADTTGALDNDNAASLRLQWGLVAGSNFTSGTLATTWATNTSANAFVGQTNVAATLNNYWQMTGVQLEVGPVATPFEFEDYSTTLAKCQRYYWKWVSSNSGDIYHAVYQPASSPFYLHLPTPVTMRARPSSATISGTWSVLNTSAAPTIFDRGDSWIVLTSSVNAGIGNTAISGFNSNTNSSTLIQDAEL